MMNIYYGKIVCNKIQTKNWKKLHHIPMKLKPKTCAPWGMAEVVQLHIGNQYVSKESISTRTALLCREYMNEDPLVDIERIICLFLEEQVLNRKKYPEKQMDYVYLKFIDAILIEYEMGHKKYDLDILVDRTHISRDQIKDILYRYS